LKYSDVYPTSYCGSLIRNKKFFNYYKCRRAFHIRYNAKVDKFVHILGTGTLCYHTNSIIGLSMNDFKFPNMADIWFGVFCQLNKIPLVLISKEQSYIKYINFIKFNDHDTIH
jgi:hypothetical protein